MLATDTLQPVYYTKVLGLGLGLGLGPYPKLQPVYYTKVLAGVTHPYPYPYPYP